MKWFDRKEVKDLDKLSPEQIKYLKSLSLTIFGPFNVFARRHWDIVLTALLGGTLLTYLSGLGICLGGFILSVYRPLPLLLFVSLLIFGIVHGRRLAWNRNQWGSFEDFQRSEKRWLPWAIIVLVIVLIPIILFSLSGGFSLCLLSLG